MSERRTIGDLSLDDQIAGRLAKGYEIVQQGRVLIPYEEKYPKPSFAERVEGFKVSLNRSGDVLLDDDERWVHMRKSA